MHSAGAAISPSQEFGLSDWLLRGVQLRASDIHLHSGYPPMFRLIGNMTAMSHEILTNQVLRAQANTLLNADEKARFDRFKDVDFVFELKGVARFRGSMFMSHTGTNINFRILPAGASTLQELGLPPNLSKFTELHHGLVLITGPAGCGKSTTLAALVDLLNVHHKGSHILTLEDPIEIVHANKLCLVNQRQVMLHTSSYERAMRAALREDPDVIVIGEMRDPETTALALTAAETGHLVLASMHTTDAVKSITRVVDSFPAEKQDQIRTMLAESLQGVFSQLLLPTADGKGRVVAYELLMVTPAVSNMIRDKKTFQISQVMQMGRAQGMITMSLCIGDLVRAGKVSRDVAKKYADETYL